MTKYECQRCHDAGDGKYQDAFTVKSMTTLPRVLAIHVRRQALGPTNSKGELTTVKIVNRVILPPKLTLKIDGTEQKCDMICRVLRITAERKQTHRPVGITTPKSLTATNASGQTTRS